MKKSIILIVLLFIFVILSLQINLSISTYDVVVIGGEPEGVAAAVASGRNGANTLLIDHRDGLGGLFTYGMLNQLDLGYDKDGNIANQGIFMEWFELIGETGTFDIQLAKDSFHQLVGDEENIELSLNTEVLRPIKFNNKVIGLIAEKEGNKEIIIADRFIDSTADADFAALADVPYFVGQEDIGLEDNKMAVTLVIVLDNVDWEALKKGASQDVFGGYKVFKNMAWGFPELKKAYKPKEDNVQLRGLNIGQQSDNTVTINALQIFGVDGLDEDSKLEAIEKGKRETENIVKFLRENIPGFENAQIASYPTELYVRETRHIIAEYQLSITDVWENKDHWDSIGIGAYPVDVQQTTVDGYAYYVTNPIQYSIPFRSLVPKEIDNILVASKASGYSSLAAGSARTVPIGMTVGEAAGTAATLSINNDIGFREMAYDKNLIEQLQEQLIEQEALLYHYDLTYPYEGEWVYSAIKKLLPYGIIEGGYNNDLRIKEPMAERDFLKMLSSVIKRSDKDLYEEILLYYDPWEVAMETSYEIQLTRDRAAEILLTLFNYESLIDSDGNGNWETCYEKAIINEEMFGRIDENRLILREEGFHLVSYILNIVEKFGIN